MDRTEIIKRDLNPHKAAVIAMLLYGERYAKMPHVGSMGFWDTLTKSEQETCKQCVERVDKAPNY